LKHLYIFQDEESKDIKIGRASDVERRFKEVRRGTNRKYKFLYSFKNLGCLEKELHLFLADYHVRYEWFEEDALPKVLEYLESYGLRWGKDKDFKNWIKKSDDQLYDDIKHFILVSVGFGCTWSFKYLEKIFRMTEQQIGLLADELEDASWIYFVSSHLSSLIDSREIDSSKYSFVQIGDDSIVKNDLTFIYGLNPLSMCEVVRRSINEMKIELIHLVESKFNSSDQISLF
jgi:hypothetical protein